MEKFSLHKNNNMQSHLTIISLSDTVSTRYLQNSSNLVSQMTGFLSSSQKGFCLSAYQDGRTQLNLKNCIKTKDFYWRCCRSMAYSHSSPSLSFPPYSSLWLSSVPTRCSPPYLLSIFILFLIFASQLALGFFQPLFSTYDLEMYDILTIVFTL